MLTQDYINSLERLARLDLGPDAQADDITYHIGYLLDLTAAEFQHYLRRLGL
jgi:hypothetical protein